MVTSIEQKPFKAALCRDALLEWPRYKPYNIPEEVIGTYCIYNGFLYYIDIESKEYYITADIETAEAFLNANGYKVSELFMFPENNYGGQMNISLLDQTSSEGHQIATEHNLFQRKRHYQAIANEKGVHPLDQMEYEQTIEIDRLGIDVALNGDRQRLFLNPKNEGNLNTNVGTFNLSMNGTIMFINDEGRTFISPAWDYYLVLLNRLGYTHNPELVLPEQIASYGYIPTSGSVEIDPIAQKWNHWKADCIQRSQVQNDIHKWACEIFEKINNPSQDYSR